MKFAFHILQGIFATIALFFIFLTIIRILRLEILNLFIFVLLFPPALIYVLRYGLKRLTVLLQGQNPQFGTSQEIKLTGTVLLITILAFGGFRLVIATLGPVNP